tara:strand:- start:201 stop:1202 length:1002 start_codon:yes stop_codon:yes gene_type:complete
LKNIFILGCNGFIGSNLVKALIDKKFYVTGIDITSTNLLKSLDNNYFSFKRGDVFKNMKWIENQIKKSDIVLPLVAIATPNVYVKDPLRIFNLDFESNLEIIKLVYKWNKRLIFPSTSEVYGITKSKFFNEEQTQLTVGPINKSRWIYSCCKQLLDRVIFAYGEKGMNFNIFRPFNWIGPKLDNLDKAQLGNGRVMSIFINNLINNKDIVLVDGGLQKRAFTYIDDGIDALYKIISHRKISNINGHIFNIGNPNNISSIKNLSKIMLKYYNFKTKNSFKGRIIIKNQKSFYGKGYEDIEHRAPDVSKIKKYLKWEPKYNLDYSIRKTIDYYIK